MSRLRILTILGARPQFIKAGPVSRAIHAHTGSHSVEEIIVHTGQHYDRAMSDVFFEELELRRPTHHLEVGSGSHGEQTGRILERLDPVLRTEAPDIVLVYGDTNSTLAGALSAAKLNVPIAHIESGARSYRRSMPEEINRVVTDHLSTWLFCATPNAVDALAREGLTKSVHVTGDVMYDAVLQNLARAKSRSTILAEYGLKPGGYALATVHRAENTNDPDRFRQIIEGLAMIAQDRQVVWPVHPRTEKLLAELGARARPGLRLVPPASYLDMLVLTENAGIVLTDSGGVQREAFFLGTPCLTLRDETEWPETIEAGWNQLVGSTPERIAAGAKITRPATSPPPVFGDGHAAERIVAILAAHAP